MSEPWMPIDSAPKNGVCVLLKLKDPIPEPNRLDLCRWSGIIFVARHSGFEGAGWQFAAPVGHGGFPDRWISGWLPLEPQNIIDLRRNLRHWRDECGKLHAQLATAKDQRNQYQKKAQINYAAWNGTMLAFIRARGLEQDLTDFAGGWACPIKPEPASDCDHDWQIWPETDGQEQRCMKCGKYRKTQSDIEECGNHSAGSPPR